MHGGKSVKLPSLQRRTLMLIGVGAVTAALFGYVVHPGNWKELHGLA